MTELERWVYTLREVGFGLVFRLAMGLVLALVFGLVMGLILGLAMGLGVGLVFGLIGGLVFVLVSELAGGLAGGIVSGLLFGLGFGLLFLFDASLDDLVADRVAGLFIGVCVGVGYGLGFGLGFGLLCGLGAWIAYFRLFYFPIHAGFWFLRPHPSYFRFHPAAWDWNCLLPFPGLDRLLVACSKLSPATIEPEIDRLIREVPGQRRLALRAFTILRARRAARIGQLRSLAAALDDLPEGAKGFLADTRRVRELVAEIVQAQVRVDATSRAYFRELELRNLVTTIRNFEMKLSGMHEPVATEFRRAAEAWLGLAEKQLATAVQTASAAPVPQVFRAGDPVQRGGEAFVPRFRVLEEMEGQVMLGSGCPGLLLRGPRRMGKSSLLKNVGGFLPREVGVAVVSLQSARFFTSLGHLVGGLSEAIAEALSLAPVVAVAAHRVVGARPTDLPGFAGFLDQCNATLDTAGRRVLVALDEYEMLDEKLREGVFTKDLLATLRESIQSHRRIIWAFSGNADITELTGAEWTSYLISVRTLEVPVFSPEETHLLLIEPLKHSALREEDKAKSALFWREFWGDDGIARIHAEAGGWPYFLQLIAETAVALANESGLSYRPLPAALLEQALDSSVERGRNAFHQLLRSPSQSPGEWEYLAAFATRETQMPPEDSAIRRSLDRRRLLIPVNGECALRVPLMRRWLRREG